MYAFAIDSIYWFVGWAVWMKIKSLDQIMVIWFRLCELSGFFLSLSHYCYFSIIIQCFKFDSKWIMTFLIFTFNFFFFVLFLFLILDEEAKKIYGRVYIFKRALLLPVKWKMQTHLNRGGSWWAIWNGNFDQF